MILRKARWATPLLFALGVRCAPNHPFVVSPGAGATLPPTPAPAAPPSPVAVERGPAVDVLTQHNDAMRTGANLNEVVLTPSSVRSGQFHRLFHWQVEGQQYAQPLYLSDVNYNGRVIDMIVVATMKNVVEAFEVPPPGSIKPGPALWIVDSTTIGAPLRYNFKFMGLGPVLLGHNISPWIGITSSPVIDRELGLIYVCAKARDHTTGEPTHYLVSIDLAGKVRKIARIPDMAASRFTGGQQLQRPALLEANHRVYVAFGAHEDFEPYHGWVFAYDAETLEQKASFCTTCGSRHSHGGGIWQAGGGLAADASGGVYLATGNGTYEEGGGTDVGSSFLHFTPNLELLGSWTPPNWSCQNTTDSDLGSAGPLFDANTSTLVGGGKEGVLYALRPESLRGRNVGAVDPSSPSGKPCRSTTRPAAAGAGYTSLQASPKYKPIWMMDLIRWFDPAGQMLGYQHIHGSPVSWQVTGEARRLIYLSAERDYLRAFALDAKGFLLDGAAPGTDPKALFRSKCQNSMHGMPGGALSLSAHGGDPESGIVWVSMPQWNRDALHHVVPGVLRAYRAYPGPDRQLTEIWNSERETDIADDCESNGGQGHSAVGLFAKGAAPTVARGRVYLGTFSNELVAYGIAPRVAEATTMQASRATLEVDSVPAAVAPNSLVTVGVTITNRADVPWKQGDARRLFCDDPSGNATLRAESLPLQLDGLAAHRALVTNVTLIAPEEEGTHQVRCRIGPPDGLTESGSDLHGTSTAYIALNVLRPECADLRARRDALYAQFKPDVGFPARMQPDIERLKTDAAKRGCYLGTDHHMGVP